MGLGQYDSLGSIVFLICILLGDIPPQHVMAHYMYLISLNVSSYI